MKRTYFFIFGFFSCILLVTSVEEESTPKKTHTIKEGDDVYVICNNKELPAANPWWTWNTPGSDFYEDGPYLNISNIQRWQAGEYLCHVTTTDGSGPVNVTVDTATVDVQYPCDVSSFSITPQKMKENDTWYMECNVTGNPAPSVLVLNNDTGVTVMQAEEASRLNVSNQAKCWDTGLYLCLGSNELNTWNSSSQQRMEILCAPRPDYRYGSHDAQTFSAYVGDDLNITMYYLAYPYPNFTWTHPGYDITPEEGYDRVLRDTLATTLLLKQMQFGHFGDYVIDVENSQGSSQSVVHLVGKGPPKPPTNLQVNGLYDYVLVKWHSGFDNFLKQTFLLKYRKEPAGSEWQYVEHVPDLSKRHWNASVAYLVRGLEINSQYQFTVSAINNNAQESSSSNMNTFQTHVPAQNTVTVLEGNPLNVKCNNTLMPEANTWWTWNVTGSAPFSNGSTLFLQDSRRWQAGQYLCYAHINTTGQNGFIATDLVVDTATVNVQYPCDIVAFSITGQRINEHDPWSMQCDVMGNPAPTFTIMNKDTGTVIKEGTTALNFSTSSAKATCLDTGTYVCTGYNALSKINAIKYQILEVLCAPRPDPRYSVQYNYSYAARVGEDVTVKLYFLAFPDPQITWSHPGTGTTPGQRQDTKVRGSHVITLTLKGIQPDEFGQYEVQVQNSQGSAPASFAFISGKDGPPEPPTNLEILGGSYTHVTLKWLSGFDYFRKQTFWLKYRLDSAATWLAVEVSDSTDQHNMAPVTYTLTGLQSGTRYNFEVSSTNDNGQESAASTASYSTTAYPKNGGNKRHISSVLFTFTVLLAISNMQWLQYL